MVYGIAYGILIDVGIDPETEPLNQVIVSQGHHPSLHTNVFLNELYTALLKAEGDEMQVKAVLYWYRIRITVTDPWLLGY